ncbi:MAG: ribonuclease PH, partial [Phycisphaerae bacterium]
QEVLDLDYREDSASAVDMNVAMTGGGKFIELQGTSEGPAFDCDQLDQMLRLARRGLRKLLRTQRRAIVDGMKE